ncbi:unnamed protein product [Discosporangium mesarthrocarpum]
MKTSFAASVLAMAGCADAFVAPTAPRAALSNTGNANAVKTTRASTSTPTMEFAGGLMGGAGPEPNSVNFDPFNFAGAKPENVLFYREAEIKHGRIAMLAICGLIAPEFVRVPGEMFQNVSVLDAHNVMVEKGPMFQLLFWISLAEILTASTVIDMDKKDREPGDFALDPANICKASRYLDCAGTPAAREKMRLAELKHGRLAMLGFSGAITQMAMTGHGFPFK